MLKREKPKEAKTEKKKKAEPIRDIPNHLEFFCTGASLWLQIYIIGGCIPRQ